MKIENEVTGEIADVTGSYIGIRLHICSFDGITDFFAVDVEEKEITTRLNATTKILLNVEHTFEDYMKLIADLGLEIPSKYKKHWTPKINEAYFYFDPSGEICPDSVHKTGYHKTDIKRYENYNAFPKRELAEKGVNASKLERLMLLWQYANICLFMPDWLDGLQHKYYIIHDGRDKKVYHDYSLNHRLNNVYFETSEQAKAFIEMYSEEIKKIMEVE